MSNFQSMIIGGWEGLYHLYGSVDAVHRTSIAGFSQESITSGGSAIRRASNIFAGGYQAIESSTIYSGGIDETDIICNNNDICNIYCLMSDSCDELGSFTCDDENCTMNIFNQLPTQILTSYPTIIPSYTPTSMPTSTPTNIPTNIPISTAIPTSQPSTVPTTNISTYPQVLVQSQVPCQQKINCNNCIVDVNIYKFELREDTSNSMYYSCCN